MSFTNEEILRYIVKPMIDIPDTKIRLLSEDGEKLDFETKERIEFVCFDDEKEEFYLRIYKWECNIFQLNEEFMFIDDIAKNSLTSSDTHGNVVYNGNLREKTHEEILKLIHKTIMVLTNAKSISFKEEFVRYDKYFPIYNYIVQISNNNNEKNVEMMDNITFEIN